MNSVKLLFSDKITVKEIINLTENGEILSSDTDITDTFNDYFSNVAQNLNIPRENSILNTDLCINPVLKRSENRDLIAYFILHNFNNALSCSEYPASLKYANITPIFKKDDKTDKTNYRPISILPKVRKIYERFMQNQMCPYLNQTFSKYQCGFRKGYNAQHCLMATIEK